MSERSERVKYFSQHEKRNFISPSNHVISYLLYKHQWNAKPFYFNSFWSERCGLLWSHSNGDIFTCEDNMLFSHVKSPPPTPWAMSILVILSNRWQETESVWKWFGEHWWRYSSSKSLNFTKICMFGRTNLPRPQHTNICKFSQIGELNLCLFKTYQFQIWQFS